MLNVPAKHLLTVSFPEMKSDMFKRCLYGAAACATSRNDYSIVIVKLGMNCRVLM